MGIVPGSSSCPPTNSVVFVRAPQPSAFAKSIVWPNETNPSEWLILLSFPMKQDLGTLCKLILFGVILTPSFSSLPSIFTENIARVRFNESVPFVNCLVEPNIIQSFARLGCPSAAVCFNSLSASMVFIVIELL